MAYVLRQRKMTYQPERLHGTHGPKEALLPLKFFDRHKFRHQHAAVKAVGREQCVDGTGATTDVLSVMPSSETVI